MKPHACHQFPFFDISLRGLLFWAWCLAAIFPVPPLQAAGDVARNEWMKGFEKLESARQAEDAGRREQAASLYAAALDIFNDVSTRHPSWNPALLRYRIRFCRDKIDDLRKSIDEGAQTLSRNELLDERDDLRRQLEDLQSTLRGRTRELEIASQAMERARREAARNAAAREQTESLLQERTELNRRLEASERQLADARREIEEVKGDDRERRRAAMLADRLQLVESDREKLAEELAQTRRTQADLERRLADMGEERERLRTETTQARGALARHEQNQQTLNQTVATLNRQLGEEREIQAVAVQQKVAAERRAEDALRRAGELAERQAELEGQVKRVEQAKADAENKAAVVPQQMEALTAMLRAKDRELGEARDALRTAETDAENKERQLVRIRAVSDNQTADVRRLQSRLGSLEENHLESAARVRELEAKLEHATQGRSGMQDAVDRYREQVTQLERDRDMAMNQAESRLNLLRRQEQEIRSLGRRIDELDTRNETLKNTPEPMAIPAPEIEELEKRLRNAVTENEYQRQLTEEVRRDLQRASARVTALETDLAAATQGESEAFAKLRDELAETRESLEHESRRAGELETRLLTHQPAPTPAPQTSDGDLVVALLHQGVEAEKDGNLEAAIWHYRKLLESEPNQLVALERLGALALQTGNDAEAIRYLERAFYANPDKVETLQQLGFALVRQENPDLALSMLARAAALNQDNPQVHNQLGVACSALGWKDAAEVQFRRALKLAPKDPESAFNLAVLLASSDKKHFAEAKQWYQLAREQGAEADPALDDFFGYPTP